MNDALMIEELSVVELEQRVEFGCFGGADGCSDNPDDATYCNEA